jgi:secreted trypsin-like serine protease
MRAESDELSHMARRPTPARKLSALALALVFATLSATSAAAGAKSAPQGPSEQIVGGTVDRHTNTKWVAALLYKRYQVCGGSLVNRRIVLTAAHCTIGTKRKKWRVRLGSKNWARGGVVRRVKRIYIHPRFNRRTLYGDLSVLKLSRRIPRRAGIRPVTMVSSGTHHVTDPPTEAYIAGWGQRSENNEVYPHRLRSTWVWLKHDWDCANRSRGYVRSVMICAGAYGRDTCYGDSGGPLAFWNGSSWRLVGVTSFGIGACGRRTAYAWVGSPRLHPWLRYL